MFTKHRQAECQSVSRAPRWHPRRPKIAPRRVQDRLGSVFCLLIFLFDFRSFWDRFWCRFGLPNEPRGARLYFENRPWGGPRRSQDRLGSVLFSSCRSGSLFWSSWAPLGVVFGRSVGRFGAFSAFQLIDSTHQLINSSIQPINSSTHRFNSSSHHLIDSTHQPIDSIHQLINPWPFGTFLPGPADCALRD